MDPHNILSDPRVDHGFKSVADRPAREPDDAPIQGQSGLHYANGGERGEEWGRESTQHVAGKGIDIF